MIKKEDVKEYTFSEYRKKGTTRLSDQIIPAGEQVETLEGVYTCAETSRLAIDANGNVYPVAVSIFDKSYEKV